VDVRRWSLGLPLRTHTQQDAHVLQRLGGMGARAPGAAAMLDTAALARQVLPLLRMFEKEHSLWERLGHVSSSVESAAQA